MTTFTRVLLAGIITLTLVIVTPPDARATEDAEAPPATETETPPTTVPGTVPNESEAETAPPPEVPAPEVPETVAPKPPPTGPVPTFIPVRRIDAKRKLVFPIVGVTKYYAGFGDCRDNCTREHFGVDILTYGWKGLPVVAAQDGTVTKVTYDKGKAGCSIRIRGRDRWQTRYIHLNNDVPGTDETGYPCPAPGIEVGSKVAAGQVIGWVGDSGNAEHTVPNLHFELRTPGGYPVDPYRSLRASEEITYEWLPPDAAATSRALFEANWSSEASIVVVIPVEEAADLTADGAPTFVYDTPIIFIDREDPRPAIDAIDLAGVTRVVIMSNTNMTWLQYILGPRVQILETVPFPPRTPHTTPLVPDAIEPVTVEHDPPDRFVTIFAGAIDQIRRRNVAAYDEYTAEHLVMTFRNDRWARTRLGSPSRNKPPRYSDKALLWWNTGDGWVGTESIDLVPDPGFVYVSDRRVNPWTLAYLGSLSKLPEVPVWWGDGN